jgi:hypothetical protein
MEGPAVDAAEIQAKATIAAALIVSRAVELPTTELAVAEVLPGARVARHAAKRATM